MKETKYNILAKMFSGSIIRGATN